MKQIDNTILTRKAFRDLVKLFEGDKKSIVVSKAYDRWKQYGFVLQFLDGCVLPSNQKGSVLCFTSDTSKALKKKPGIDIDVSYVSIPRNMHSTDDVSSFLKKSLSASLADAVYFESLPVMNGEEMFVSRVMKLVAQLDNSKRPVIYNRQFSSTIASHVDSHDCLQMADIVVGIRGCVIDIYKSPNNLINYSFFYNCQKDIKE